MTDGDSSYDFDYHYRLAPALYERRYYIGVRLADSGSETVDSFATLLFWPRSDGAVVEVARMDNWSHSQDNQSGPHIHRWYRETDEHRRDYAIPVDDFEDAELYLVDHFETFARKYESTHGSEIVAYDP